MALHIRSIAAANSCIYFIWTAGRISLCPTTIANNDLASANVEIWGQLLRAP